LHCDWFKLNGSVIEFEVNSYKNKLANVKKVFKNKPETEPLIAHIDHFLDEIKEFEQYIPLATNLTSKAIESRHFEQLSKTIGIDINPN
jgi:alcohol dehydrogenase class IV